MTKFDLHLSAVAPDLNVEPEGEECGGLHQVKGHPFRCTWDGSHRPSGTASLLVARLEAGDLAHRPDQPQGKVRAAAESPDRALEGHVVV